MIKNPALEKIEKYFNMPFEKVILDLHWEQKISINSLSKQCGVSRDTFGKHANKLHLQLRSNKEATKLTQNKGPKHWAFGLRKESSSWAKAHSDRMKLNNPVKKDCILKKFLKSQRSNLLNNLSEQEIIFKNLLINLEIEFEMQKIIGRYIVDFFIPSKHLIIEIDSIDKMCKKKKKRWIKKKNILKKLEYKFLSINRTYILKNELLTLYILASNNVI